MVKWNNLSLLKKGFDYMDPICTRSLYEPKNLPKLDNMVSQMIKPFLVFITLVIYVE